MPHDKTVLLLTANPDERDIVQNSLDINDIETKGSGNDSRTYYTGEYEATDLSYELVLTHSRRGQIKAAGASNDAVSDWEPDLAFMLGIAGGIKADEINVGDVVATDNLIDYESSKTVQTNSDSKILNRRDMTSSNQKIEQLIIRVDSNNNWKSDINANKTGKLPESKYEPVASGNKLQGDAESKLYDFLKEQASDAIAVEMEGYAFAKTMSAKDIPFASISTISDIPSVEEKSESNIDDFMPHTVEFLKQMLNKYPEYDDNTGESEKHHNHTRRHDIDLEVQDNIPTPDGSTPATRTERVSITIDNRESNADIEFSYYKNEYGEISNSNVLLEVSDLEAFTTSLYDIIEEEGKLLVDFTHLEFTPIERQGRGHKKITGNSVEDLEIMVRNGQLLLNAYTGQSVGNGATNKHTRQVLHSGPMIELVSDKNFTTGVKKDRSNKEKLLTFLSSVIED